MVTPDRFLQQQLKVEKEDRVWKVTRVREMNGEKIILDKDFFNQQYVTELTYEICENSVYEYIENELGLNISFAKKKLWWNSRRKKTLRYCLSMVFIMLSW